mmetsp:Transcript_10136/g.25099  ORF Transcript_10136/g.25099 Transcript_10136/m.25099 type:complete len:302 (+) Transcript_10136:2427-3332(+)
MSQKRLCPPSAPIESNWRGHRSQTNLPSSLVDGGPVCPLRKRLLHAEHSVFAPSGPGPLPEHSSHRQEHQPHRQLPPSQKRLCPLSAPIESNLRSHSGQTNLPSLSRDGGFEWPVRWRLLHTEHSVRAPAGPGPFPEHSSCLHSHHAHRQFPASQKRLWPPRALIVAKGREQSGQRNLPSSFFSGIDRWPARKREPHALHSVFPPDGPCALEVVSVSLHRHHSHLHSPRVQKRLCPESAARESKRFSHELHGNCPSLSGDCFTFERFRPAPASPSADFRFAAFCGTVTEPPASACLSAVSI